MLFGIATWKFILIAGVSGMIGAALGVLAVCLCGVAGRSDTTAEILRGLRDPVWKVERKSNERDHKDDPDRYRLDKGSLL
jgi:hypothetical protein